MLAWVVWRHWGVTDIVNVQIIRYKIRRWLRQPHLLILIFVFLLQRTDPAGVVSIPRRIALQFGRYELRWWHFTLS